LKGGEIPVREDIERRLKEREYARTDKEFQKLEGARASLENLKAAISIPFISKGKLVGILNLGEKMSQDMYNREDLELLGTIANQAVIAIENAKLYGDILTMKDYTDNVLKDITSGVITVDLEGRIVSLNKRAEKITGEKLEEVVGKPCLEVYKEQGELGKILFDTLKKEEHYVSRETTLTDKKEEKKVFIGVSTSLLRDGEGKKIGALAAFADLSDIKKLEEHMRRTDRLAVAGTLAAGMAHEIKNPLSSIEMFTQLIPYKFDDEKFRNKFNNIVLQELGRLNNLVEALLSFARPSQPQFRLTQINKTLDRVLNLMEVKIFKHNVEVVKEYDDNLPEIPTDEKHLIQVFMNLTLNAVEAMSGGGKLRIKTGIWLGKKRGKVAPSVRMHFIGPSRYKFVEVKFSDTGKGISSESLSKLFDPFFSTKEKGTGLGLSVVHQIIEQHEGSIDVESEEGVSTTFTIRLPLEREEEKGFVSSGITPDKVAAPLKKLPETTNLKGGI
jgi:PAS domain S-box-containing protein